MNKKHIGSSFDQHKRELYKKNPRLREAVEERVEKARVAMLVRRMREAEHITQSELARRAGVTQSVIARIEGNEPRALPRLDLLNKIASSLGYHTTISVRKGRQSLRVALS
jgi:DNA-binding XRE family transcriptional regulator